MKYIVYILYSRLTDRYYIGQTNDIQRRLSEHNDPTKNSFTKHYQPWRLLFKEEFLNRTEAVRV
ncbi:MAG: endonuclease, partial [Parcubacteria group bacterium CG23_combo_of_CG06-09_8_20_14_all_35_6]